jgi:hypothetical protein
MMFVVGPGSWKTAKIVPAGISLSRQIRNGSRRWMSTRASIRARISERSSNWIRRQTVGIATSIMMVALPAMREERHIQPRNF